MTEVTAQNAETHSHTRAVCFALQSSNGAGLLSVDGDVDEEQVFAVVAAYAASVVAERAGALPRTSGTALSPQFRPAANFRAFHKQDLHTEPWSPA
ncbi:MAG: hypothetical protein WCE52_18395 [Candidatus Acidiferrum sp.]